jgi:hypothetical protein
VEFCKWLTSLMPVGALIIQPLFLLFVSLRRVVEILYLHNDLHSGFDWV